MALWENIFKISEACINIFQFTKFLRSIHFQISGISLRNISCVLVIESESWTNDSMGFVITITYNQRVNVRLFFLCNFRLVDGNIVDIIRNRMTECELYHGFSDFRNRCPKEIQDYTDASNAYFIKCKFFRCFQSYIIHSKRLFVKSRVIIPFFHFNINSIAWHI